MADSSDRSDARTVVVPETVFRFLYLRWSAIDRGWKATLIGLLILLAVIQT
jgi:hypothetical protein